MRLRSITVFAVLLLLLAPASFAQLSPYNQDFENINRDDPGALAADGWKIFANVFAPNWAYLYGYGVFGAPNGGNGFSAVDFDKGGPEQGIQHLSVYSDYNNGDHGNGNFIEANVFQEQFISADDVGRTWVFEFDALRGNIEGGTTARAWFKTLDPNAGFSLTRFIWEDMTFVTDEWERFSISIDITPDLEGQILQFGFLNVATNYEGSGVFYDNITFGLAPIAVDLDIRPRECPNPINTNSQRQVPVALLGTPDFDVMDVDPASVRLEGVAPIAWKFEDASSPFNGPECGCNEAGPDGIMDLVLVFDIQEVLNALGGPPNGDSVLELTGQMADMTPVEGQLAGRDCVIIHAGPRPLDTPPANPFTMDLNMNF